MLRVGLRFDVYAGTSRDSTSTTCFGRFQRRACRSHEQELGPDGGRARRLAFSTGPFTALQEQGGADGVSFEYRIEDGSRRGDTLTLAVSVHENEGVRPEVAPHWVYSSPDDFLVD